MSPSLVELELVASLLAAAWTVGFVLGCWSEGLLLTRMLSSMEEC